MKSEPNITDTVSLKNGLNTLNNLQVSIFYDTLALQIISTNNKGGIYDNH